jgi:solute carrier family 45 protein 1/2/4
VERVVEHDVESSSATEQPLLLFPLPRMTSSVATPADPSRPPTDNGDHAPLPSSSTRKSTEEATPGSQNGPAGHQERQQQFQDGLDEQSPLLSPSTSSGEDDALVGDQPAAGGGGDDEHQKTKSIWYLILLTISIGGLQIAWSVEMSNGSPYLLSLGLSKSLMALVWIAGPLSGTLVQPYVGMLSDNCRIRWGKRKPFMLGGAAATIVSLMFLAWTKEIVGGFLGLFGAAPDSDFVKVSVIVTAVLFVYVLDFAINTGEVLDHVCAREWVNADGPGQCRRRFVPSSSIAHPRINKVRRPFLLQRPPVRR